MEERFYIYKEDKDFLMLMTEHEEVLKSLYKYNIQYLVKKQHNKQRTKFRQHLDRL